MKTGTKIICEPKLIDLEKGMAVRLPYKIEVKNNRLYDILAVDDEGQLVFANSQSYYVKDKKGNWYRPFARNK